MVSKKLLTKKEVAVQLNCCERTVTRLIDDGRLIACKVRGSVRVTVESLEEYLRQSIEEYQLSREESFF